MKKTCGHKNAATARHSNKKEFARETLCEIDREKSGKHEQEGRWEKTREREPKKERNGE